MYTSGSTGKPKGVMLTHRGIVNQSWHRAHKINVSSNDIFCHTVSTSFVSSIIHWYVPLFIGAKLVVYSEEIIRDPYELFKTISRDKVTMVEVIASTLRAYLSYIKEDKKIPLQKLRILLISGEQSIPATINTFFSYYKNIQLINGCGQCECSALTLHYIFDKARTDYRYAPIGKPISNTKVYVLDENLNMVPRGVPGELCISGDGLAKGYLNNPEKTKKTFIPHPFIKNKRLYRTGDIVKILSDNNIVYLHRRDNQIKVRGYRVELAEIENCISGLEKINECRVISSLDKDNEVYLAAYYTGDNVSSDKLKESIKNKLPAYMIPQYFVYTKKFPRNPNGKIDYNKLREIKKLVPKKRKYVAPKTRTEIKLKEIWKNVLDVKKISLYDSFFDIGGHSLKAIKLLAIVNKHFYTNIKLNDIFINSILKDMAEVIDDHVLRQGLKILH
jgi:acyl-coenzyme A synthetase/AMP-(fatty) acid ligase/acyl carrier protein